MNTRNIEEISIGDYILSGGESASFVVIDAVLRLLPGVLGNNISKDEKVLKMDYWNILNIQNLKFGKKKVFQKSYYQAIMLKLRTGVYHNQRI